MVKCNTMAKENIWTCSLAYFMSNLTSLFSGAGNLLSKFRASCLFLTHVQHSERSQKKVEQSHLFCLTLDLGSFARSSCVMQYYSLNVHTVLVWLHAVFQKTYDETILLSHVFIMRIIARCSIPIWIFCTNLQYPMHTQQDNDGVFTLPSWSDINLIFSHNVTQILFLRTAWKQKVDLFKSDPSYFRM